jgi:putative addiction module killer protein
VGMVLYTAPSPSPLTGRGWGEGDACEAGACSTSNSATSHAVAFGLHLTQWKFATTRRRMAADRLPSGCRHCAIQRQARASPPRLQRLTLGLRGDGKSIGSGLFELRIDHGPGYRVYCAQHGKRLIVLLCGGDKRMQTRDIERAHDYWKDHQERTG